MLTRFRLPLILLLLLCGHTSIRADETWQKLRKNGAESYYADLDLRAVFAKANPGVLPEPVRKPSAKLPQAFDWTAFVKDAAVFDQKASTCCWAFASVSALSYSWAIRNGGDPPALAAQPIIDRVGKQGSGYTAWPMKELLEHGTCLAADYEQTGKPGKLKDDVQTPFRAIAWGRVAPGTGMPPIERVKQALLDHGPLVANIYSTPDFKAAKDGVYREAVNIPKDGPQTSHILLIVGWDDKKGKAGAWKIQNSWGERWGEKGYLWIEYGSNNIGHTACWVRAQSVHYKLPEKIQKQVTREADAFPEWPDAKSVKWVTPNLPILNPVQARFKMGERVVVQMRVLGGGVHSELGDVELFSEKSWQHEQVLIVRIVKSELDKFGALSDMALYKSLYGHFIQVRGSVQMNPINVGNRPIIEVGDPQQIRVLK